jgi:hypothetical protein
MFDSDYTPPPDSPEGMYEALSGKQPKAKPKTKSKVFYTRSGLRVDKSSTEYNWAVGRARVPVPLVDDWTFGMVQLFRNQPRPRVPEYRLKLSFTQETDFDKLKSKLRMAQCDDRFIDLSIAKRFRENSRRLGRPLDPQYEQPVVDALLAMAKNYNANRPEHCPEARLGFVGKKFAGEGFIRHGGQFALVMWFDIAGEPVPTAILTNTFQMPPGEFRQQQIDLALPPEQKRASRGERASQWLAMQYSPEYRQHLVDLKAKKDAKAQA